MDVGLSRLRAIETLGFNFSLLLGVSPAWEVLAGLLIAERGIHSTGRSQQAAGVAGQSGDKGP
jgi:hypothetical protein